LFTVVEERPASDSPGEVQAAKTNPREAPGRAEPGVTPTERLRPALSTLLQLIDTLKSPEVPSQISRIERDLREATAEERELALRAFETRLRAIGLRAKDVTRWLTRLRGRVGGSTT
jgi:hypothetical protein